MSPQKTLETVVTIVTASPRRLTTTDIANHLTATGCTCRPVVAVSRTALLVEHQPACPANPTEETRP